MTGHLLDELRNVFERQSADAAITYGGQIISFGQLDARARRSAAWLQQLGVTSGDRVVLFTPQKLPFLAAYLGALYAGAVPLPLNPRFTLEELRYFLTDSGSRVVVAGDEQSPLLNRIAAELPNPPVVAPDSTAWDPPAATFRDAAIGSDEPSLILYSSGTTGWPKGIVHTHANQASALRALAECWRLSRDDVVLNVLPLFHIHGLGFATLATWLTGGCVAIQDAFDVQETLHAIGRATVFMAVPSIYYRLLDEAVFPDAACGWSRVRLFTCGSAPIRAEILPRLEEILGHPVINRYGMTEAHVITSLPLDGPWPGGSVGLPLAGVEQQIVRSDGTSTAPGEVGSVQIRGPNLFHEYWNKPEATQAAFAEGWFDTGDLGSLDEDGYLTLVGRKHDLIITSGYNVYPQVVERVIGECPGVAECAVLGLADAERGECVAAVVVRNDRQLDEARLRAWWTDRLVHYQRPRVVTFVDALPRNAMGKVLRRELRETLQQAGESSRPR